MELRLTAQHSSSPMDLPASSNSAPTEYPPRSRPLAITSAKGSGLPIEIAVREARDEDETRWVQEHGEGLYELVLATNDASKAGPVETVAGVRISLETV